MDTMAAAPTEWTPEQVDALPDSSFGYISPGGTLDAVGKTTPRSLRRLPFRGEGGIVDEAHLRKAIEQVQKSVLPQVTRDKVEARLRTAATKSEPQPTTKVGWTDEARAAAAEARARKYAPEAGPGIGNFKHESGHAIHVEPNGKWAHEAPNGAAAIGHGAKALQAHLDAAHPPTDPKWGKPYGESLRTSDGLNVNMHRGGRGNRVRFYDHSGAQVGPEQENVAPALAYASHNRWSLDADPRKSEDVEKYITRDGDKWTVHAESGKVLGTHDSEKDAQAQLAAVEANKHPKAKTVEGPTPATVKALQGAFLDAWTAHGPTMKSRVLKAKDIAKAEVDVVEETPSGAIYRVRCAGREMHFAAKSETAVYLPYYSVNRRLAKTAYVVVAKAEEQRYTLGVVYPVSAVGKPEPDFHGDVMTEVELEKSAWGFMAKGADRVGLMHREGTTGAGRVVESYIYRGPSYTVKDIGGQDQEISTGDWLAGVCWNSEGWAEVKAGNIKGYSLQGSARKVAAEDVENA